MQDSIIPLLTPAAHYLTTKKAVAAKETWTTPLLRPTILTNEIDGTFNTVRYNRLAEVIILSGIPNYILKWTLDWGINRTVSFYSDGHSEIPEAFDSRLPQGPPLSSVLFIVYSAPTIRKSTSSKEIDSIEVDKDPMLQGSPTEAAATKRLQHRLDIQTTRAIPIGQQYAPHEAELIHLYPSLASRITPASTTFNLLQSSIPNKQSIQLLGVVIDHKLTFRQQISSAF